MMGISVGIVNIMGNRKQVNFYPDFDTLRPYSQRFNLDLILQRIFVIWFLLKKSLMSMEIISKQFCYFYFGGAGGPVITVKLIVFSAVFPLTSVTTTVMFVFPGVVGTPQSIPVYDVIFVNSGSP